MIRRYLKTCAAAAVTVLAGTGALAQEGYPLDGTWRGEWGSDPANANHVVIVMKWDGQTINGQINPGPRSVRFDSAVLDPSTWTVVIEATGRSGEVIRIEGRLADIGSYNRTIEGTWLQDDQSSPFKLTRE